MTIKKAFTPPILLLLGFFNLNPLQATDKEIKQSPLETMGTLTAPLIETLNEKSDYDSGHEYQQHQKAHKRFFRRNSKNPQVRNIVENFKIQYDKGDKLTPIKLDGLSSRSHILLVRELTSLMLVNLDNPTYWTNNKGRYTSQFDLKFLLDDITFVVRNSYSQAQPGDLYLVGFDKHVDIQKKLKASTKVSSIIANLIIKARKDKAPIKDKTNKNHLFCNRLNFLLDLEVARRLQNDIPQNDYDNVPIGSGIANFLDISSKEIMDIDHFFKQTDVKEVYSYRYNKTFKFPYGTYNIFEGEADKREEAVKNIIKKRKEDSGKLKTSKCEEIHQDYLKIFQGSDESSGDSYSDYEPSSDDEFY